MEFMANLLSGYTEPRKWALDREREGWDVLGVTDHLPGFPHLWSTLGEIAAVTSQVKLASAFANNLFRSPVEFAQASLAIQRASGGRFEAGLGAGWMEIEMTGTGRVYPDGPTRAAMYREAVEIARALLTTGACKFSGEHYTVDIAGIVPQCSPPPILVGAPGGPRTMREITPLVDRVEIQAAGAATRGGGLDFTKLSQVTRDDLRVMVERVRDIRPGIPVSFFALCAAGEGPELKERVDVLGDNLYGGIVGHPEKVAGNLMALQEIGIDRVNVSPTAPGTEEALAPFLLRES